MAFMCRSPCAFNMTKEDLAEGKVNLNDPDDFK